MADETITVHDEEKSAAPRTLISKTGIFFCLLAMIAILTGFTYGYYQLAKINLSLVKTIHEVKQQTLDHQESLASITQTMNELKDAIKQAQESGNQHAQALENWQQGNLSKWYAAEVRYLIRLANDNLHFTYNTTLALHLLEEAEKILKNLNHAPLLEIQKSLSTEIANLRAANLVDSKQVYLQLNTLSETINQLPLPKNPITASNENITLPDENMSWWKKGLHASLQSLQKIVIVRRDEETPLVLPQEKQFLYQNLFAQLQIAMWSVLNHQPSVYQTSLERAQAWIKFYFDQASPLTQNLLRELSNLSAKNLEVPDLHFSDTLQLLDNYLANN